MMLWRIAIRNILATKVRTAIIGLLTLLGTALVVVGGSLLSSVEGTMSSAIVKSIAGHFQIYSDQARDKLDLFNPPTGTPDLGELSNFAASRRLLEDLPEVKSVVPMGTDVALVFTGNIFDVKFEELRKAWEEGRLSEMTRLGEHIRLIATKLLSESANLDVFKEVSDEEEQARRREILTRVASTAYWEEFPKAAEAELEFLENDVASLAMDEQMLFLRYLGTDTGAFEKAFPLFEIVKGESVPEGKRGFLFSDFVYEQQVKNPVARRLDFVKDKLDAGLVIAEDRLLTRMVQLNARQVEPILFQLDAEATREVTAQLREFLGSDEEDLSALLELFLDMNDGNFRARYEFFYRVIAPRVILYKVRIGDTLTIRTVTRAGYATAVNVKVYGTYQFKGLEKSALAGVYNLMDIMTYRDLYGQATNLHRKEVSKMVDSLGVEEVERDRAEEELFGDSGEDSGAEVQAAQGFDEFEGIDMSQGGNRYTQELMTRNYSREEIDSGMVVQAAVILNDGVSISAGREAIESASEAHGLGLKLADWKQASGVVGQFIGVVWVVLVVAIAIIFLVALVIINNSMVMATLDRTQEIGTMRAMGSQRGFILRMFLIESSLLGVGSGVLGLGLGVSIILWLNALGIPAWNTELYFLFAGPRLYPILAPEHLISGFVLVFIVSVLSTLYPAMLAARITPVRAMDKGD